MENKTQKSRSNENHESPAKTSGGSTEKSKFEIHRIELNEKIEDAIVERVGNTENYFTALTAQTYMKGKPQTHFVAGSEMIFQVRCAASKLFVNLKSKVKFQVEWLTYDLRKMQPLASYSFVMQQAPNFPCFDVFYRVPANIKGLFGFNVLIVNPDIEFFDVLQGGHFQVG